MFDWILTVSGEHNKSEYYSNCFRAGYNSAIGIVIEKKNENEQKFEYALTDAAIGQLLNEGISFDKLLKLKEKVGYQTYSDSEFEQELKKIQNDGFFIATVKKRCKTKHGKRYQINDLKIKQLETKALLPEAIKTLEYLKGEAMNEMEFEQKLCLFDALSHYKNIIKDVCVVSDLETETGTFYTLRDKQMAELMNEKFTFVELTALHNLSDKEIIDEASFNKSLDELIAQDKISANKKEIILKVCKIEQPKNEVIEKSIKLPSSEQYKIIFKPSNTKHPKSEVSFGLASITTVEIENKEDQVDECFGEIGFIFENKEMKVIDSIKPKHFRGFGAGLQIPNTFKVFNTFIGIYTDFVNKNFGLDVNNIKQTAEKVTIQNYVQNLPEYKKAMDDYNNNRNEAEFEFAAPLIILIGQAFFDEHLLKTIFK